MDAVIAQHKPTRRIPAPALTPWTTASLVHRRRIKPGDLVPAGGRVVLVAPHPDDEILALGATLATLAREGHDIVIVAVTDGEGSHPHSARWNPDSLREARPRESHLALSRMDISAEMLRLGLPDGAVARHEKKLAELLPLGSTDTVFVPWRHDGHADHEACARAALAACRTVGARCIEFPVWALVPSHAAHARLNRRLLQEVRVPLALADAKRHAIGAFASQTQPDGATAAVLRVDALESWQGDSEWILG